MVQVSHLLFYQNCEKKDRNHSSKDLDMYMCYIYMCFLRLQCWAEDKDAWVLYAAVVGPFAVYCLQGGVEKV